MKDIIFITLHILMGISILSIIYSIIMLYRNSRVCKTRIWFIDNEYDLYLLLPSYKHMLRSLKPTNKEYWLEYCRKQLKL